MSIRRWLGLAVAAAYVGVLAYSTATAQCPVRPESGCAKVHALMLTARAPRPMVATPMRAEPELVRVAAALGETSR